MGWIDRNEGLPLARQCDLAGVPRSSWYTHKQTTELSDENLRICHLMDEEYTRHPFYGSRRMLMFLEEQGYKVNRKRVQRLMRLMGLAGMAPGWLCKRLMILNTTN
jgi:putative transposase